MNNPKISVIIPVYNGTNYVREAISSALAQTYPNFEVLVINDGSTDRTEEVVLSYGDKIRYFAKENGGVASALNLGIRNMTGEYVSWLSHDDLYMPDKLAVQMEAIRRRGDKKAIAYSDYTELNMADGMTKSAGISDQFLPGQLEDSVFPVCLSLINGCSLLIHVSHFDRVGPFREDLLTAQDYDMWFRMLRGQRLVFVPRALVCSRLHKEQGTHAISSFNRERLEFYRDILQKLSVQEVCELFDHPAMLYGYIESLLKEETPVELIDQYKKTELPPAVLQKMRCFQERFQLLRGNTDQVCIFGCGVYGQWLRTFLTSVGIPVQFLADNDPNLWGRRIGGCVCLQPQELPQISVNTVMIAAMQRPGPVVKQLRDMGCPYVTTKQAVDQLFYLP